jgi:hypothetical protein
MVGIDTRPGAVVGGLVNAADPVSPIASPESLPLELLRVNVWEAVRPVDTAPKSKVPLLVVGDHESGVVGLLSPAAGASSAAAAAAVATRIRISALICLPLLRPLPLAKGEP